MQPGDNFEQRFEILRRAGTGGMGTVFQVLDQTTGRNAALKVLREPNSDAAERFLNESRLLATLEHPHIVRHIAHGVAASGEPWLVMEWLDGESLSERLERGILSVDETLELMRHVADALGVAHTRGIVHRDIKPSNLFLVGGLVENVKILDFGIARQFGTSARLTAAGSIVGTPGYMAPEQARGDRDIGPTADVFALGCVMFECLSGKPAFQGAHPVALLAKLLFEEAPNLRETHPDVPASVAAFIARTLAKDVAARPADGTAVASELSLISPSTNDDAALSVASAAITGTERRLVSIVAVLPPAASNVAFAATMSSGAPKSLDSAVRRAAVPLGAAVEELANGAVVAVLVGKGNPTDQAAAAARCALWVRAEVAESVVVLVTGRAEGNQKLPIGQVLERAAVLLDKAASGRMPVRIDASTQALLDSRFFVTREQGRIWLHGERRIGEEPRLLLGQASPFVGRDREFRNILSLVEDCFEERRSLGVLVTGAPGMGKSRLRQELSRQIREQRPGVAFVLARADAIGAGSAYGLVTDSLRSSLLLTGGEPLDAQREKVKRLVNVYFKGDQAQRNMEFLGELAGTPFADDESPRLRAARQNPQLMADQIQIAFVALLEAITASRSALFVLEDLHWGDAPSIKLFDAALRELRDRPIAIVAFARPEVREVFPRLWADRNAHEVRLGPLPRRAAMDFVSRMLGQAITPERTAAIVERAQGNAFYLEELIRSVADGQDDTPPETVLGMVEARLARLPQSARRILRAASVFGEVFWRNGVRTLLGGDVLNFDADLSTLVTAEVIAKRAQSSFAGEDEYAFRHALLREGAYAMLADQDRQLGHRMAAEWLERAGELDAMTLAEHFERGKVGERAAMYYLRAAEKALRGSDWTAAVSRAERGRSCGPTRENRLALHAVLCEAATLSGQYPVAIDQAFTALSELGFQFPAKPEEIQPFLGAILSRVVPIVMQTSLEELASLPRCTDAEAEVTGRLLRRVSLAVVFGRPELLPVMAFTMVEHTLKHGISRMSAGAFGVGAIIAILGLQNLELASRLCHLAERHLPSAEGSMAYAIHVSHIAGQYLAKPTETFFDDWMRGADIGKREGDTSFAEYCVHTPYLSRLLSGIAPLRKPPTEEGTVDYNSRPARRVLTSMHEALVCGDVATAQAHVRTWMEEAPSEAQARHKYLACAAYVMLHVDDIEQAFSCALQAEPYWRATACLPDLMAMVFSLSLSAALLPKQAMSEQANAHRSRLEQWASFTPGAFRHQLLLVDAARAWQGSEYGEAERLFLHAITDAHENGYSNNEALGQRLLGVFYEEQKKWPLAREYLHAAAETYLRWGAPTCARAIRQRYSHHFAPEPEP